MNAPAHVVASNAFRYAIQFFRYADAKYSGLKAMSDDTRHAAMQAAIVVSTLIQQERLSPEGAKALRASLPAAFPVSARRRCTTAVQDLAVWMLKTDRSALGAEEIPPMGWLTKTGDKDIQASLSLWLGAAIMNKRTLSEADQPAANAMGRSAWTSAVMIGRQLQGKTR